MKTLITFSAGFVVATLCLSGSITRPDDATSLHNHLQSRDTSICHNCASDDFLEVPVVDFFRDVKRYQGTHVKAFAEKMRQANRGHRPDWETMPPSRVCMYTLDTLKKFICFVETYSKAAGIPMKGMGIEFNYAIYEKNKKIHGNNYGSLHTLYMVPTYYDPRLQKHIRVDVKASALDKGKFPILDEKREFPYTLESLQQHYKGHTAYMLTAAAVTDGEAIINQGQLCPPACSGIEVPLGSETW